MFERYSWTTLTSSSDTMLSVSRASAIPRFSSSIHRSHPRTGASCTDQFCVHRSQLEGLNTFAWDTVTTEAQRAAIYNWSFVACDGSLGVHNAGRAVRLLQLTYQDLTGHDVPGATLR